MLEVDLSVQHRRNFLYRGYGTRIEATFTKRPSTERSIPIATLFSRIVHYAPNLLMRLRQAEVRNEDGKVVYVVQDIRGRPPESFSSSKKTELKYNKSEELFFSSGILFQPPANFEDYPEEVKQLEQQPFAVEVNTAFHRFTSDSHVQHKVHSEPSQILKRTLGEFDLQLIPKLFPAELHEVRVGIEYFKERKVSVLAGILPPSVKTRFFLELGPESVYLLLEDESGGKRGDVPQFEENLLGAIDRALDELDLFVGLSERVTAELASK